MDWARILAFVTGMVDQELLARNEYLAAENRILKGQLEGRLTLQQRSSASWLEPKHRSTHTSQCGAAVSLSCVFVSKSLASCRSWS